jgi:mxaA protein
MKNLITKLLFSSSLLIGLASASLNTIAADIKTMHIINPLQSSGIQVGDVLNRSLEFAVDASYQIDKSSLPMKGEVRNGIELNAINIQSTRELQGRMYKIDLRYQVFAGADKPVVLELPAEKFSFNNGEKVLTALLPAWHFWFSPLVAEGILNAKENMQPQYKASLINSSPIQVGFLLSLSMLGFSLLGLIYNNANHRWLPFMNGAFAQAQRKLKLLSKQKNTDNQAEALLAIHQAFNQVYGANLFVADLNYFLAENPKFKRLTSEITRFFDLSNSSLFSSSKPSADVLIKQLLVLSKQLRDCERGVK